MNGEARHTTSSWGSGWGSVQKTAPPGVSWSRETGRGDGGVTCTPCLYLHPGQLVPGGRENQVGLEIPEEKEDIPQQLKHKPRAPFPGVGSPCPTICALSSLMERGYLRAAWAEERLSSTHRENTPENLPREPDCPGPFAGPLPTPAVRRA